MPRYFLTYIFSGLLKLALTLFRAFLSNAYNGKKRVMGDNLRDLCVERQRDIKTDGKLSRYGGRHIVR